MCSGGFSFRFDIAYACSTRNLEHAHFSRSGHVADAAELNHGCRESRCGCANALERISEGEQATGEIGMSIALEIEHDRFSAAFHPDFTAHHSFGAIVNLAADHAVVNPKRH